MKACFILFLLALCLSKAATYRTGVAEGNVTYSGGGSSGSVTGNFQTGSQVLSNLAANPRVDYTNQFIPGSNITLTTNAGGVVTIAASGGGGGLTTNANQFGESVELTIKDGVNLTNINVHTALNMEGTLPTLYNPNSDGSLRVGVAPGSGGIQFQIFGPTYSGQENNAYFDSGASGGLYLRWNGTVTSLVMPGASAVPNLSGWNVGERPAETNLAAGFLKIKVDGVDAWLPYFQ